MGASGQVNGQRRILLKKFIPMGAVSVLRALSVNLSSP